MSAYKDIIKGKVNEDLLKEFSLPSIVSKILSKLGSAAGKDSDIANDPGIMKAAESHASSLKELRDAIETYEKKYGKVPKSVKKIVEL